MRYVTVNIFKMRYGGRSYAAMTAETEVASILRGELTNIIVGTLFLVIGMIAFGVAAIRRRGGVRILCWLGMWSAMYGASMLIHSAAIVASIPQSLGAARIWLITAISYLIIVAAVLAFLELTKAELRRFMQALLVADVAVAVAGIGWFAVTGLDDALMAVNHLLAVAGLATLIVVVSVPQLSERFLVLSKHRVLTVGTWFFAAEALYVNIARPLRLDPPRIFDSLGFAVLLFSLGYVAVKMIVTNERRLLSIESELEIARQLQFSILPGGAPEFTDLRIAAAYEPMTAVAGDFYDFLPVDEHRIGFLIADVSGHGVPAALISSMIKVAIQSVDGCAQEPGEVLRRLGDILSRHLRGQFVSAAYLWIDMEARRARYSAAGHPPLLFWRADEANLTRIESNGLLFGVKPDCEYPVREISIAPGDRFLLYTDGVTEPENEGGESFGDRKLEQIVRDNRSLPAPKLSARLLKEVHAWQPESLTQQDDITLIVIDVG